MCATDVPRVKSTPARLAKRDSYRQAFKPGGGRYFPGGQRPKLRGVKFVNKLYMWTRFGPPPVISKAAWPLDPVWETDCEHGVSANPAEVVDHWPTILASTRYTLMRELVYDIVAGPVWERINEIESAWKTINELESNRNKLESNRQPFKPKLVKRPVCARMPEPLPTSPTVDSDDSFKEDDGEGKPRPGVLSSARRDQAQRVLFLLLRREDDDATLTKALSTATARPAPQTRRTTIQTLTKALSTATARRAVTRGDCDQDTEQDAEQDRDAEQQCSTSIYIDNRHRHRFNKP